MAAGLVLAQKLHDIVVEVIASFEKLQLSAFNVRRLVVFRTPSTIEIAMRWCRRDGEEGNSKLVQSPGDLKPTMAGHCS